MSTNIFTTATGSTLQLQSKQTGAGTNYSYTLATTSYDSADFSQPSFMSPPASGSLEGGASGGGQPQPVYGYVIPAPTPTTGYAPNGNLLSYTDSVTGQWNFNYDNVNRVTAGTATTGPWSNPDNPSLNLTMAWSYDSFGNRTAQGMSGSPQAPAPQSEWAVYTTTNTNRMDATSQNPNQQMGYDLSGDVTNDGINQYAYDAEGRVCAVYSVFANGVDRIAGLDAAIPSKNGRT